MRVRAGVAELADARDSKSRSLYGSVGSTPSSGTNLQRKMRAVAAIGWRGMTCLVACIVLAAGCGRLRDSTDVSSRSDAMVLLDGAQELQYFKNHDSVGRTDSEQISYIITAEYPAEDVVCKVTEHLAKHGWRALRRTHDDSRTPSSFVQGWRQTVNRRGRPDEYHVDLWDAEWVNADGDLLSYSLTYRYPAKGSRDTSRMRIGGLWTPNRLAKVFYPGGVARDGEVPADQPPAIAADRVAQCRF